MRGYTMKSSCITCDIAWSNIPENTTMHAKVRILAWEDIVKQTLVDSCMKKLME